MVAVYLQTYMENFTLILLLVSLLEFELFMLLSKTKLISISHFSFLFSSTDLNLMGFPIFFLKKLILSNARNYFLEVSFSV